MLRLLTIEELAQIGAHSSYSFCAAPRIQTADVQPIDTVSAAAQSAWNQAVNSNIAAFPTYAFRGALVHPPVPEALRKYYPLDKRNGWSAPVGFDIQGVAGPSQHTLFLTPIKNLAAAAGAERCAARIFGWIPGSDKFMTRGGLDIDLVQQIAIEAPSLLAQYEADHIGKQTLDPKRSSGPRAL
jgi:hypothetical protein